MAGREKGRKQARVANCVLGWPNRTLISTDIYNVQPYLITVSSMSTDVNQGEFLTLSGVHAGCHHDVRYDQPCIPLT